MKHEIKIMLADRQPYARHCSIHCYSSNRSSVADAIGRRIA
jgi:hypothetical protein